MFNSIDEVITANKSRGGHFFDPRTMRMWSSRILKTLYGGRYFVTSERFGNGPRTYSVRQVCSDGHVMSVEGYSRLTKVQAINSAKYLANKG